VKQYLRFRVADFALAVDLTYVHRVVAVEEVTVQPDAYLWGGTRWLRADRLGPALERGEHVVLLASSDFHLGWRSGRVEGLDEVAEGDLYPVPRGWLDRGVPWVTHLYFREGGPVYVVNFSVIGPAVAERGLPETVP
jgi:hypothetical protein